MAVIAAALCAAAVLLDPLDMFGGSDLPEAKKPSSESSQQFSDPVQAEGVSVQVPILLYHHISEDTLTQEQFQTEMQLLKDGGYHTVSFDQIFDFVEKGTPLPEKPVCLTFDDGYLSNYEIAYPLLKEYGMKATFFAIGATVGNTEHYKDTEFPITPHYSYEQAKEMSDSGLVLFKATPSICTSGLPMSRATGCGTTFCAGKMKRRKNIPKPLQLIFPNPGKSLKPPPESR